MESAAKTPTANDILIATDYGSWWWLIFWTVVLSFAWYMVNSSMDILDISINWPKYRCSPMIMPFAKAYGYDTTENFNYCLQKIFQGQVGGITSPFATIMSTMVTNMMKFLQNLNSLRVMLATLVGSVTKIFQEFVDRFKLILSQVKITGLRIQALMRRLFATFYAVIYMGLSGVTAGLNFTDTFIFKFLDTFCFAPDTLIHVHGKGLIPISEVSLGDILTNGSTVTSTYRFQADGQPMVYLGDIHVSTNHYVKYKDTWIQAKDHPDAKDGGIWSGQSLICLDTTTHEIPLGPYVFSDWDETEESDEATMLLAEQKLNACFSHGERPWKYQPALDPDLTIRMKDTTFKKAKDICIGDVLSTGVVAGIGKRSVDSVCTTSHGAIVTPSTLIWSEQHWVRAGISSECVSTSKEMITLIVLGSSMVETEHGEYFRDMLEVHSPDMESPTTKALHGPETN